jgi:hypothetical protein
LFDQFLLFLIVLGDFVLQLSLNLVQTTLMLLPHQVELLTVGLINLNSSFFFLLYFQLQNLVLVQRLQSLLVRECAGELA